MNKDYRTIGQILEDDLKSLNEVRYTNIYNRIKGVKGLKRKDLDVISAIDPDILAKVVNSLDFLRDDVELEDDLIEAKFTNIYNKIKKVRNLTKKQAEFIASIDPVILQNVVNQLSGLMAHNEIEEKFLQDILTPDEFRRELESELEMRGYSPKVIKKVTKKGKGYEVRVASYMKGSKEFQEIFTDMGATNFSFKKGGGVNIMMVERAPIVANQSDVIDVVLKDVKAELIKQLNKGKTELVNNVARLVGLKVTMKGQQKNKAFMYDLTKGKK